MVNITDTLLSALQNVLETVDAQRCRPSGRESQLSLVPDSLAGISGFARDGLCLGRGKIQINRDVKRSGDSQHCYYEFWQKGKADSILLKLCQEDRHPETTCSFVVPLATPYRVDTWRIPSEQQHYLSSLVTMHLPRTPCSPDDNERCIKAILYDVLRVACGDLAPVVRGQDVRWSGCGAGGVFLTPRLH